MAKLSRALVVLLLAGVCYAGESSIEQRFVMERPANHNSWKKPWIASVLVLIAANAFDAHSSMGRQELNPLLRNSQGQFSVARGFAIKSAMTGSILTLQFSLCRNRPELRKSSTILNLISAAAVAGTAVRNNATAH